MQMGMRLPPVPLNRIGGLRDEQQRVADADDVPRDAGRDIGSPYGSTEENAGEALGCADGEPE